MQRAYGYRTGRRLAQGSGVNDARYARPRLDSTGLTVLHPGVVRTRFAAEDPSPA
jgi:hypothetical protein